MGVVTQHFRHDKLGHVYVLVKPTARTIKAHWKGKVLNVTTPPVSADRLMEALDSMSSRLLAVKPLSRYYIGQIFEFEVFKLILKQQMRMPEHVTVSRNESGTISLGIGTDVDLDTEAGEATVEKVICSIAKSEAAKLLIAEAEAVSRRLGVRPPDGFELGYGRKRLGCCVNRRRISLSFLLVFMPAHLRQLIYCHELAHLTHMDHSPAFHALVNAYTNGNEARLEAELRKFKFPINR